MKIITNFFLNLIVLSVLCTIYSLNSFSQLTKYPAWKHYSIDPILPGSSWGTGGPALADFDKDGDLDVAISRRNTKSAYWYERRNDSV